MKFAPDQLEDWIDELTRFLIARIGSRGLAADMAHESVARMLRVTRAGQHLHEPRAWLFRTARNLAIDEVRRRLPAPLGLEALGTLPDPETLEPDEAWIEVDGDLVARSDLAGILPAAMNRMPPHYRRLLEAHYREGLDCQAVAEREQITLANAKVRLFRARRHLQQLLERAAGSL